MSPTVALLLLADRALRHVNSNREQAIFAPRECVAQPVWHALLHASRPPNEASTQQQEAKVAWAEAMFISTTTATHFTLEGKKENIKGGERRGPCSCSVSLTAKAASIV